MARFDFDVTEYEAPAEFGVMPEGEYKLMAEDMEDKDTKDGTGQYVSVKFTVIEPVDFKNRKVFQNFNVVNKSEKAQNFGRRMIAGWARATGKPNAKSTEELTNKPFWCKLGIEDGKGVYKDRNVISSFLMPEQTGTSAPAAEKPAMTSVPSDRTAGLPAERPAAPAAPTPAAAGGKKPWDVD